MLLHFHPEQPAALVVFAEPNDVNHTSRCSPRFRGKRDLHPRAQTELFRGGHTTAVRIDDHGRTVFRKVIGGIEAGDDHWDF